MKNTPALICDQRGGVFLWLLLTIDSAILIVFTPAPYGVYTDMNKLKYFLPLLLIFGVSISSGDNSQQEIYVNLLISMGYNYFLWTGTSNRKHLIPLGLSVALLPITEILIIQTSTLPINYFYPVMAVPASATIVFAYMRYNDQGFVFYDFIKFMGVLQLSFTYLISFPGAGNANVILGIIYLTTRLINTSKPPGNKVKALIVVAIFTLSFLNIMGRFLVNS